jgi:hypothetical protein
MPYRDGRDFLSDCRRLDSYETFNFFVSRSSETEFHHAGLADLKRRFGINP